MDQSLTDTAVPSYTRGTPNGVAQAEDTVLGMPICPDDITDGVGNESDMDMSSTVDQRSMMDRLWDLLVEHAPAELFNGEPIEDVLLFLSTMRIFFDRSADYIEERAKCIVDEVCALRPEEAEKIEAAQEEAVEIQPRHRATHETGSISAAIDEVTRFLCEQKDVVVQGQDGIFVVNACQLDVPQLFERANKMRDQLNEPLFTAPQNA